MQNSIKLPEKIVHSLNFFYEPNRSHPYAQCRATFILQGVPTRGICAYCSNVSHNHFFSRLPFIKRTTHDGIEIPGCIHKRNTCAYQCSSIIFITKKHSAGLRRFLVALIAQILYRPCFTSYVVSTVFKASVSTSANVVIESFDV